MPSSVKCKVHRGVPRTSSRSLLLYHTTLKVRVCLRRVYSIADYCGIVTNDEQGALQGEDPDQIILSLSVFVKLRKATISFVMSVCLSVCLLVRMEQICPLWTEFHEILCWNIYLESIEKI